MAEVILNQNSRTHPRFITAKDPNRFYEMTFRATEREVALSLVLQEVEERIGALKQFMQNFPSGDVRPVEELNRVWDEVSSLVGRYASSAGASETNSDSVAPSSDESQTLSIPVESRSRMKRRLIQSK